MGGLDPRLKRDLLGPQEHLPAYIPMIRHGYRREGEVALDFVALNTFEVLNKKCEPSVPSAAALHAKFRVSENAKVLFVSVDHDGLVEAFWGGRNQPGLSALASLSTTGITTPNFSFFDDAPRLHSLRNLWRIVRSAEEMADAGLRPVLHLNALCQEDWSKWGEILRSAPSVRYVCKEFQTGLLDRTKALEAVDGLRRLRDTLGRELHPIVVGGRRVLFELAKHFPHVTLVDSVPFMASVMRKEIWVTDSGVRQLDHPTKLRAPVDDLLDANLRVYEHLVSLTKTHRELGNSPDLDGFEAR